MIILGDKKQDAYEKLEKLDTLQAFLCFCQSTYQHHDLIS